MAIINEKMKKKLFWVSIGFNLILLILIFAAVRYYSSSTLQSTDEYFVRYYERRVGHFKTLPNVGKEIVFAGDGWIENAAWKEIFENPKIINRGIQQDNTAGLLARVAEISESEPEKVFLMVGSQDLAEGTDETQIIKNYRQIITEIAVRSPQTKIFVHSVLPVVNEINLRTNANILTLNKKLEALATEYNATYLNVFGELAENQQLNPAFSNDGLHLNGKGYQKWQNFIASHVQTSKRKSIFFFEEDAAEKKDTTLMTPRKPKALKKDSTSKNQKDTTTQKPKKVIQL